MRTAPVEYVSKLKPLPADRFTVTRAASELFETTAFVTSPERSYWLVLLSCLLRTRKPVDA